MYMNVYFCNRLVNLLQRVLELDFSAYNKQRRKVKDTKPQLKGHATRVQSCHFSSAPSINVDITQLILIKPQRTQLH